MIQAADEFVLYDDMQFTKRDWRNRNKIKTPSGLQWLTIPVDVKGKFHQKIKETKVSDSGWAANHWATISHCYAKAPYFGEYRTFFEDLYNRASTLEYLSEVNFLFLSEICGLLGINTRMSFSSEYELAEGKTEKLLGICKQLGANRYITGPSAANYMEMDLFSNSGVEVVFFDFSQYRDYQQIHPPFEHGVSIIDLIFCEGTRAQSHFTSSDFNFEVSDGLAVANSQ